MFVLFPGSAWKGVLQMPALEVGKIPKDGISTSLPFGRRSKKQTCIGFLFHFHDP